MLELQTPYPAKNLIRLNPRARTAVVTCWSDPGKVYDRLKNLSPGIGSYIAGISTLYGGGLVNLIRNLAYNPQINQVLVVGRDRSNAGMELDSFMAWGAVPDDSLDPPLYRIKHTERVVPIEIAEAKLSAKPIVTRFTHNGPIQDHALEMAIKMIKSPPSMVNTKTFTEDDRVSIEIDQPMFESAPSNITEHTVIGNDPYDAYIKATQKILTFGKLVALAKGSRLELQNLKVVIRDTEFTRDVVDKFDKLGLSKKAFSNYYSSAFSPEKPDDVDYTYGNRLQVYSKSAIDYFVENLSKDAQSRYCFHSLWKLEDLPTTSHPPCLTSLYARTDESSLNLSAVFRTHNMVDGWPLNLYAIRRLQEEICHRTVLSAGNIIFYSHSISVDPEQSARAEAAAKAANRYQFTPDPIGYFVISVEGDDIVARWEKAGTEVCTYSAKTAQKLHYRLIADNILSDVSHALYLGRMLQKAEDCKLRGEEFKQDG